MSGLVAVGVAVKRGRTSIIDDISLNCPPGQCVAVIGENGSGKSTLLRALAFFEPGASGTLSVLGRRIDLGAGPPEPPLWPELTIVPQDLALWPHLSARENVLLPWRLQASSRRSSADEAEALLAEFEIAEFQVRRPNEMSGGQRQRTALARAFALKPRFLLLDEPSSALDARHATKLKDQIVAAKARGVGFVCVTHNLGFASKIADGYCFLSAGRMASSGPWAQLRESQVSSLNAFVELHSL